MGVEGSVGISPASAGCQETLRALVAAGAFRAAGGAETLQRASLALQQEASCCKS